MIKKVLIYTLLLFACYNIFLCYWQPERVSSQNLSQENQIIAQEFIYTNQYDSVPNFIVGSSMSFRLHNDSLSDFFNLGFLGEGYMKGLQLIERKGIYPKKIFIEINLLSRKELGGYFFDVLDNPIQAPFRSLFPALRDGKQPILVANSIVEKTLVDSKFDTEEDRDKYSGIFRTFVEPTPGMGVYAAFDKAATTDELDATFADLDYYIDKFEKKGTQIVFFQMPYAQSIQESPRFKSIINAFENRYPPHKFIYLPYPKTGEYKTLDGSHLGSEEAAKYTSFLKKEIENL